MKNETFNDYINSFLFNEDLNFIIFGGFLSTNYYLNYKRSQINFLIDALDNIYLKKTLSSISSNVNPKYISHEVTVQSGDSFEKILNSLKAKFLSFNFKKHFAVQ